MESNKKQSKIIIVLILIIVTLTIALLALLFTNNISVKNNSNEKESKEEKTTKKEEEKPAEETTNDENTQSEEVRDIDLSKSLNTTNYTYNSLNDKDTDVGIVLNINEDKKSVTAVVYEKGSKLISNLTHSTWSSDPINKTISGFNKNIESTFICGIGQSVESTKLFFIMEDGTVQYANLFDLKTDGQGNKYYSTELYNERLVINEIPNVTEIIKLYGANAHAPQSTGHYTTLAAKKNGTFYDLGEIIK